MAADLEKVQPNVRVKIILCSFTIFPKMIKSVSYGKKINKKIITTHIDEDRKISNDRFRNFSEILRVNRCNYLLSMPEKWSRNCKMANIRQVNSSFKSKAHINVKMSNWQTKVKVNKRVDIQETPRIYIYTVFHYRVLNSNVSSLNCWVLIFEYNKDAAINGATLECCYCLQCIVHHYRRLKHNCYFWHLRYANVL